ncbi:glycoside hydrolase family 28 protein [Celerinatantimonas diazotrophica]|uniref:Polygalacturonase n=1 Tax=Celerinatantimonas diazotrophica TaxID=412034 RepID=A0A4R1K165_9GAMM|nr:glycosyl hydrolase family 28 protein [Celerinatantimonas diazotrophica]TCK57718.1 polygalacturonase [Celerinatantimonas diazotrophica]CAG9298220.1 hypothetical protein CEDIAZO_03415 [Celerinatantimonas diazotrophica]
MQITLTALAHHQGQQDVSTEFQQALDQIAQAGGGTLTIPTGRYRIGALQLPSNLYLWLEAGAELIASPDYQDFQGAPTLSIAENSDRAMLYARHQQNITIAGPGVINGNANAYFTTQADEQGYRLPALHRPRLIVFEDCQQIRLRDFTIIDAPMWTVHLVSSAHIFIDQLTINNDLTMANTDALDIDSCQYVQISNCHFSSADDGICLKTTDKPSELRRPTEHVLVQNCLLRSYSCAFKIGTETFAAINDISVNHCTIYDSNRAIGIVSRDGGVIQRLRFTHINFACHHVHPCHWGKADPIFISCRHRDPAVTPGAIRWVSFSHFSGTAEGAINMHTDTSGSLQHILLNHLHMQQCINDHTEQGLYDVRPPCNPEHPTGMGLDNAYRLNPNTGQAFGVEPYPKGLPAIYTQGVEQLHLEHLIIERPPTLPKNWDIHPIVQIP